ncbi:phosphosulfolactate synthase [uncultured Ilumatobacter sp.]|uniref:phosphosulfolactate synthase n=1 Tax=uncultured Ilumatobacter sp. TaxID=879968 RepID=UPI00374EE4CA
MDSDNGCPDFLKLPGRSCKPRQTGVTHVLDKGVTLRDVEATLAFAGPIVDIWKFGWGTAYVDRHLPAKLAVLEQAAVHACTGGTLLEIAWVQGRTAEFFDWAVTVEMPCVEVSNGATGLPVSAKRELISEALDCGLTVLSEVGSKDPTVPVSPDQWVEEIAGDIRAGAFLVVAEGRESGTVGLYTEDGEIRNDVVAAIDQSVDGSRIIYEAPRRNQQAGLIRRLGPAVNLGNIAVTDILSVETLRLGLRSDTMSLATADRVHGCQQ